MAVALRCVDQRRMRTNMILITGVTGTVGRAVLEQAAGVPARVLIRDAARAAAFEDVAEVAIGDFADPASLEAAVAGIDAAFMASFDGAEQLALQGNLIAAAKHAGVRHMVRLSALSSDENAEAALARWHGVADRQLVGSGLGYTLLRPGLFAQNLLEYAASGAIALPVGETRVSFIDVRDIAAVAVKALTEPGHGGADLRADRRRAADLRRGRRAPNGGDRPAIHVPRHERRRIPRRDAAPGARAVGRRHGRRALPANARARHAQDDRYGRTPARPPADRHRGVRPRPCRGLCRCRLSR